MMRCTNAGSFNTLEGADRSFARNMVSTCLRRRGTLDDIIGGYLDRPLPAKSAEVHEILRLVTAQLLILETPAHAAVATAVELAGGKRETAGYKSLVNAIARKISIKGKDRLAKIPARVDTPGWLWRSWERSFGAARTREIAEAHQRTAPLDLVLKPGTASEDFCRCRAASNIAARPLFPAMCVSPQVRLCGTCPAFAKAAGGCRIWRPACQRNCWAM